MQPSWMSLLPPFVVLAATIMTHDILLSLTMGIISAALIATHYSLYESITLLSQRFSERALDHDSLYTFGFLLIIGILVALINKTGGATAFANLITKKINSARSVEYASFFLSFFLFIDDYLSSLTVGHVMRPLTDRFFIPRAKLAYLIHSMAGPLVIIAPISSFMAYITTQLDQAGIGNNATEPIKIVSDPFFIFLQSIPFTFYSFFTIISVWYIIHNKISYGSMSYHEHIANSNNLFGGKKPLLSYLSDPTTPNEHTTHSPADLFVPLVILLATVIIGIPLSGNFSLLGTGNTFVASIQQAQTSHVLFYASLIAFISSLFFALIRKKITIHHIYPIIQKGVVLMTPAIIMVFFASTLGILLRNDLLTGHYLAHALIDSVSLHLFPFITFITATCIAVSTGSSWATIALMFPLAIPMVITFLNVTTPTTPYVLPELFPVLGAVLAGAIAGDHISPLSETTIMSASSAGSYPMDHTITQLPYTVPALAASALSFIVAGFTIHYGIAFCFFISFFIGISCCLSLLSLFHHLNQNRRTQ